MLDASRESLKEVMEGECGGAVEGGKIEIDWGQSPPNSPETLKKTPPAHYHRGQNRDSWQGDNDLTL